MDEVSNISNICQPPSNIPKLSYFYTRDFISLYHLEKNWRSPSQKFLKHPLFTTFLLFFTVNEVYNISHKYYFPNKSAAKCFYRRHLTLLLHSNKNLCSTSHKFLETSTFYHMTSSFHSGWGVRYFK